MAWYASIGAVRGSYIVKLMEEGGRVKRRQDLPPEAFFTAAELLRLVLALGEDWGLLFVALSYRWLLPYTQGGPDPDAFQLNKVAALMELYLSKETHENDVGWPDRTNSQLAAAIACLCTRVVCYT